MTSDGPDKIGLGLLVADFFLVRGQQDLGLQPPALLPTLQIFMQPSKNALICQQLQPWALRSQLQITYRRQELAKMSEQAEPIFGPKVSMI